MSLWCRMVGMLLVEVLMIVIFVALFGWFPMDMWQPWVMFVLSFFVCFGVSVAFTALREKVENQKMETALSKIKQKGMRRGDSN